MIFSAVVEYDDIANVCKDAFWSVDETGSSSHSDNLSLTQGEQIEPPMEPRKATTKPSEVQ